MNHVTLGRACAVAIAAPSFALQPPPRQRASAMIAPQANTPGRARHRLQPSAAGREVEPRAQAQATAQKLAQFAATYKPPPGLTWAHCPCASALPWLC